MQLLPLSLITAFALFLTAYGVNITQITLPANNTVVAGATVDLVATFEAENPDMAKNLLF